MKESRRVSAIKLDAHSDGRLLPKSVLEEIDVERIVGVVAFVLAALLILYVITVLCRARSRYKGERPAALPIEFKAQQQLIHDFAETEEEH